jgi:hypothetical protein
MPSCPGTLPGAITQIAGKGAQENIYRPRDCPGFCCRRKDTRKQRGGYRVAAVIAARMTAASAGVPFSSSNEPYGVP